jgi:hypothetical protein
MELGTGVYGITEVPQIVTEKMRHILSTIEKDYATPLMKTVL